MAAKIVDIDITRERNEDTSIIVYKFHIQNMILQVKQLNQPDSL